jgi:hypothetical protein
VFFRVFLWLPELSLNGTFMDRSGTSPYPCAGRDSMRRGTWVVILIVAAIVVLGAIAMHQPDSGMASWLRSLHGARP